MNCAECGFYLWSGEAENFGLCAECRPDADEIADLQSLDAEDQLAYAWAAPAAAQEGKS